MMQWQRPQQQQQPSRQQQQQRQEPAWASGARAAAVTCWQATTACVLASLGLGPNKGLLCASAAASCTYTCGCLSCNCRETSRQQNRRSVYAVSATAGALQLASLCVTATLPAEPPQFYQLFPGLEAPTTGVLVCSALALALCLLTARAAHARARVSFLLSTVFALCVAVAQLLCAAVALAHCAGYFSDGGAGALGYWEALVSSAATDASTREWLDGVSAAGECCGWNDATDTDQNPASLHCTWEAPCMDYLRQEIDPIVVMSRMGIAASVVLALFLSVCCCLICRWKQHYKPILGLESA